MAAGVLLGASSGTLAQETQGSTVTIGGGSMNVGGGGSQIIAPGVTINGGDVVNATGIGVDSAGGSSIGASTGGDDSLAANQ